MLKYAPHDKCLSKAFGDLPIWEQRYDFLPIAQMLQSRLTLWPWTVAHQAPLSMGFSRQEYWSGLPCPPPGDLPNPGMEPTSPESPGLQVNFLPLCYQGSLYFYGYILALFFRLLNFFFLSLGFLWFLRETVSWHEWSAFTGSTICLVIYNLYFILFNLVVWGGIF